MGRKAWHPTPEILKEVEKYASRYLKEEQIAYLVGCHPTTFSEKKSLHKELREAVNRGRATGAGFVQNKLFEEAAKGNTQVLIFLAKALCGLRENDPSTAVNFHIDQRSISIKDEVTAEEALKRLLEGKINHGRILEAHTPKEPAHQPD